MKILLRITLLAGLCVLAGCNGQNAADTAAASGTAAKPAASTSGSTTIPAVSPYDSGPRASATPASHEAAERGEKLFQTRGCSACHAFGVKKSGPDLAGVSMRRTALWIENQILHPEVMVKQDPISHELFAKHALQMPNQGLTPEQAKDVVQYLKSMDARGASAEKEGSK